MAQLSRSVATLRIAGDDLIPEEISELLGGQPTRGQRNGETIATTVGVRIARFGHWLLEANEKKPEDLDDQVKQLLSQLTPDLQVWHSIGQRYQVDLFCGLFMRESNEGVCISPATLRSLGDRKIKLDLDIYGPDTASP